MLLKKLRIKGFKSFAEQTELYFTPGVNVLVGPNGCGKSNIVEAVRWALGDSIRDLRGQKQADAIFNGSDDNRALGLASVSMILDNHDAALPLEFTEVSISRKLFRNGENEYEINRSKVRLKDINRLFLGTGLGKQGYAIIGQGELEAVLNGHPFSRRLILEEAAGIIKFRQEREEVKKKLLVSEQDFLRIRDLLAELAEQRLLLAEKSRRAQNYLQEKTQLDEVTAKLISFEIAEFQKQYEDKENRIISLQADILEYRKQADEQRLIANKLEAELASASMQIEAWKETKYTLDTQLNRQEAEQELLRERLRSCGERIEQMEESKIKLAQQLKQIRAELIQYRTANQDKIVELEQDQTALTLEAKQVQAEQEWLTAAKKEIGDAGLSMKEQVQQFTQIEQAKNQCASSYTALTEKRKYLAQTLKTLAYEEVEITRQFNQTTEQTRVLESVLTEHKQKAGGLETELSQLVSEQQQFQLTLSKLQGELHRAESSLQTLRELESRHTLYSDGVKAALKAHKQNNPAVQGILGTVADLIQIPSGFELALEVAVGRGLENIIIQKGREAREAIDFLETNKLGRVTFLPLDTLKIRSMPPAVQNTLRRYSGVKGIAAELLTYDSFIETAVQYLFGNIVVVEDLNHGLKLFKDITYPLRIVTLNGALLNSSGAITGGFSRNASAGILTKKAEKNRWEEQTAALSKQYAQAVGKAEKLTASVQKVNEAWQKEEKQVLSLELKKEDLLRRQKELLEKRRNLQEQLKQSEIDSMTLDQELAAYAQKLEELNEQLKRYEQTKNEQDAAQKEQQSRFEQKLRAYEIKRERLYSMQEKLAMKTAEIEQNKTHLARYEQIEIDYLTAEEEAEKNLAAYQAEQLAIENQLKSLKNQETIKRMNADELRTTLLAQTLAYDEKLTASKTLKTEIAALQQKIDRLEQSLHIQELQKVRAEMEVEIRLTQWQEYFNTEYIPPENPILKPSVKLLKEKQLELQQAIEFLGNIDLDAIEEYTKLEQRYQFLQQQSQDLQEGKNTLQNILNQTEKQLEIAFNEFFGQVEKSFIRTFQAIFGGGEANLRLSEVEESFNAGVDIIVKLPGKKLQNLDLLSGGERALTCIAFIFSLLHLKSTPFCFLDEIDAALDETNLIRFNQYLNKLAEKTQFIIISHRQPTIVNGSNIYGITMEQKGISKCISLNMDEASRLVSHQAVGS